MADRPCGRGSELHHRHRAPEGPEEEKARQEAPDAELLRDRRRKALQIDHSHVAHEGDQKYSVTVNGDEDESGSDDRPVIGRRFYSYFFFEEEDFFRGTFPPARRASESPMAIACLRLVTFFPERPDFSFPSLRSRIALSTFS